MSTSESSQEDPSEENLSLRQKRQRQREQNITHEVPTEREFVQTYRLTPLLLEDLCRDLVPLLRPLKRSDGISHTNKVMTALAFYASGLHQRSVDSCMAQQTVSDVIREVTEALNQPQILGKYIQFPQNREQREAIKLGFYEKFGMPGVIGCVDGTHVALIQPRQNEDRYFNRKYYHSRNVQVICDSDLNIISVDASYGGASHDSFIFNNSHVKIYMEQLYERGYRVRLLGDSGYAQRTYMMTPIADAVDGTSEAKYNTIQKKAWNTIQRTLYVLKSRWRCLLAAKELHYDPITVGKIINACCVLHNICNRNRLEVPGLSARDLWCEKYLQKQSTVVVAHRRTAATELQAGKTARDQLVHQLAQNKFPC